MRSKCSATADRGFTLLELVVVVGLLAMAAGLAAASLGGSGPAARRSAALRGVTTELAVARIEAMRTGRVVEVAVMRRGDAMIAQSSKRERSWPAAGLVATAPRGEWRAEFDSSGRTTQRTWGFSIESEAAGERFVIDFDPVSGAPHLRRSSEPGLFTEDRP